MHPLIKFLLRKRSEYPRAFSSVGTLWRIIPIALLLAFLLVTGSGNVHAATTTARTSSLPHIDIGGNYSGTISNADGTSSRFILTIQQSDSSIDGQATEFVPLAPGDGPISGTTSTDSNGNVSVQFSWQITMQAGYTGQCGQVCTLDFRGYLYQDGTLGGTYTIEEDNESGTWRVASA